MKKTLTSLALCLATSAAMVITSGCTTTTHSQTASPPPPAAPPEARPAAPPEARPAAPTTSFGPGYAIFEQEGIQYRRGSMAFPTGIPASSGLLLEKVVPVQVLAGTTFDYVYTVKNVTAFDITEVKVWDRVTANFTTADSTPKATGVQAGVAHWDLGELAAGESKTIRVRGSAKDVGTITTCGWATYNPVLCEPIVVVKADIQLVKTAPAEVLICDPIPYKLTVRNSGSSTLTNVRITDQLPDGITVEGQRSVTFDAGTLAPGASRDFAFNGAAARTGRFVNPAKVTSTQGVSAEASATTVVRQPVLTLACETPAERFPRRPFDVCFTVGNRGDAPSAATVVEVPLPAGLTFRSATAGGRLADGKVIWDVGSLAPNTNKQLCFTVVSENPQAEVRFTGTARGTCAQPVNTTCTTRIVGIPAILIEVVDLEDPIEVGSNVTYEITVTNQGSAPGTNIRIVAVVDESQSYVSGSGSTAVTASGRTVTMAPVPSLAPKAKATWRVVVKANAVDDARFSVKMTSDQLTRPVEENEATNQY